MSTRIIDIVFDGPPSHESGRFVEVEECGKSINFGDWVQRPDGYWVLRFAAWEGNVLPETELQAIAAKLRDVEADRDTLKAAVDVFGDRLTARCAELGTARDAEHHWHERYVECKAERDAATAEAAKLRGALAANKEVDRDE